MGYGQVRFKIYHEKNQNEFTHLLLYYEHCYLNPLTAKLFTWNFYSLEVVSRWRDPHLQVSENIQI